MTRTTRADLQNLLERVQEEAEHAGILRSPAYLFMLPSHPAQDQPYRLRLVHPDYPGVLVAFEPADGNGGDIGRTAREAEHTLRIMWATLRTVNRKAQR